MKKFLPLIAIGIVLIDQASKYLIATSLELGEKIYIIGNWMKITYVQNRGVAFSMFSGNQLITIILTSILLILCLAFILKENENKALLVVLTCIFAGGVGNLIDRIFKGYVVDMISCGNFAVFNVADIFVTCGCILCAIYLLFFYKDDKKDE